VIGRIPPPSELSARFANQFPGLPVALDVPGLPATRTETSHAPPALSSLIEFRGILTDTGEKSMETERNTFAIFTAPEILMRSPELFTGTT
jgi:hypothetical protein